jgi:hypothetical protein
MYVRHVYKAKLVGWPVPINNGTWRVVVEAPDGRRSSHHVAHEDVRRLTSNDPGGKAKKRSKRSGGKHAAAHVKRARMTFTIVHPKTGLKKIYRGLKNKDLMHRQAVRWAKRYRKTVKLEVLSSNVGGPKKFYVTSKGAWISVSGHKTGSFDSVKLSIPEQKAIILADDHLVTPKNFKKMSLPMARRLIDGLVKKNIVRKKPVSHGTFEMTPLGMRVEWLLVRGTTSSSSKKLSRRERVKAATNALLSSQRTAQDPSRDPWKNFLKGGLSAGKRPSDFDARALRQGMRVEAEHTSSVRAQRKIAMDHLTEDKRYYTKLARMEGHGKGRKLSRKRVRRDAQREGFYIEHNSYGSDYPYEVMHGHMLVGSFKTKTEALRTLFKTRAKLARVKAHIQRRRGGR